MGILTSDQPKCMTEIDNGETILSRQLKQLVNEGISEVVMTTGSFDSVLVNYCYSLELPIKFTFVKNELYKETNYIYSIYCAREYLRDDDIVMMHGDLVFEQMALSNILNEVDSCMAVSMSAELPDKDFKAVVEGKKIKAVGIEFFNNAVAAQPLYKLMKKDWNQWLNKICEYCQAGNVSCYAENAFNDVSDECNINAFNVDNMLCCEVDTPEDLAIVSTKLKDIKKRKVYMCFSTDIIHSGHIAIIKKCNGQ